MVAPRCQHTCKAVLLRDDDGDLLIGFGVDWEFAGDIGGGNVEFKPHVSSPSSDEPFFKKIV